ncbi:MAG: fasciclin domain-containing protein [Saprospiraceae bacterium]|nr:fasciclin domain-containing protein [Saprospiraceae bacterium]
MQNLRTTQRSIFLFALSLVASLFFFACQKETLLESAATPQTDALVSERSNNTIVDIAISNPDFSTLVAAVVKTNLVGFLSRTNLNATVFAPNNAAFAALPAPFNNAQNISAISNPQQIKTLTQILRYHVSQGAKTAAQLPNGSYNTYKPAGTPNDNLIYVGRDAAGSVFINGNSKVVAANVQASNGIIHVIDKVLFFPTQDVAQIAISNKFTALVAALNKTKLTNLFMMPTTNATVFAPTDAAFAALPAPLNNAANIESITDAATINLLASVLQYHVVGGRVFSADLRDNINVPTLLSGKSLNITLANGAMVKGSGNNSGSKIVLTDLLARNGVIHVIDQVLLP